MPIVDFGLEGKVATIHGASRGIGECIARAFAELGATVVLSSRRQDGGKADQIEALFRRVDSELGPKGIRVNAIAPGVIETRFSEAVLDTEEKRRHWREWLPAGRHGQPADIAGAAVYLASGASSYCTGHTLGGRRRRAGGRRRRAGRLSLLSPYAAPAGSARQPRRPSGPESRSRAAVTVRSGRGQATGPRLL
ncbi:MAG TPA: SDR family oxidoreductase [Thermoanaerobaculia bacterium]|nr:SDR family oxidoreductase [Thermoanaerobaculia bacterium]